MTVVSPGFTPELVHRCTRAGAPVPPPAHDLDQVGSMTHSIIC